MALGLTKGRHRLALECQASGAGDEAEQGDHGQQDAALLPLTDVPGACHALSVPYALLWEPCWGDIMATPPDGDTKVQGGPVTWLGPAARERPSRGLSPYCAPPSSHLSAK